MVAPWAAITWRDGRIRIAGRAVLEADDAGVIRVIDAFRRPTDVEEVAAALGGSDAARAAVVTCARELVAAGVLVDAAEIDREATRGWSPNALALHRGSRGAPASEPTLQRATGAIAPARNEASARIALERPKSAQRCDDAARRTLPELLDLRRSGRAWPRRPVAFAVFAALLWLSARDRGPAADGHVSRPYPSGGARYSLELYPILGEDAVATLAAGIYGYRPEAHGLELLGGAMADVEPCLDAAARAAGCDRPPIVLAITSRFARQAEAYSGDLAYSLVLKEVGALMQTLSLVAAHLDLACCVLGGGTPDDHLAQILATAPSAEPLVGEVMLGPRMGAAGFEPATSRV